MIGDKQFSRRLDYERVNIKTISNSIFIYLFILLLFIIIIMKKQLTTVN